MGLFVGVGIAVLHMLGCAFLYQRTAMFYLGFLQKMCLGLWVYLNNNSVHVQRLRKRMGLPMHVPTHIMKSLQHKRIEGQAHDNQGNR